MRKTVKKLMAALLTVGMLFPLAACTPTPPTDSTTGPQVTTDPFRTDVGTLSFSSIDDRIGFDTRASTMTVGNFMYYDYTEIIPGADEYDYEIPDGAWEKIEAAMQGYAPNYREGFSLIIGRKYGGGFGMSDPKFNYWQYD